MFSSAPYFPLAAYWATMRAAAETRSKSVVYALLDMMLFAIDFAIASALVACSDVAIVVGMGIGRLA